MHFKNINIKLFYPNNANNQKNGVLKKMNSKVQKWIICNA